jgi:hypothetical protein
MRKGLQVLDFIFKRKSIVIDAFTNVTGVYEYFPIQPANKFMPNWWKSIPQSLDLPNKVGISVKTPTLKTCSGFIDLYQQGFIMPLWADLIFETKASGEYAFQFSNPESNMNSHMSLQFGNALNNIIHLKIISPWYLNEKTGIKFLLFQPMWNHIKEHREFIIPPGVVDFKNQVVSNINMFVPAINSRYEVKNNTPLMHIIPLTDKKVTIKHHLVDDKEFNRIHDRVEYHSTFVGKMLNNKKLKTGIKKC